MGNASINKSYLHHIKNSERSKNGIFSLQELLHFYFFRNVLLSQKSYIFNSKSLFHYTLVFSPTKIRQILFQIIQRFLQIFFPNALHDIGMMCNIQCRIHVGPGLPVELGIGAF